MMTVSRILAGLIRVVAEEAKRNPDFEARLRGALGLADNATAKDHHAPPEAAASRGGARPARGGGGYSRSGTTVAKRPSNRRPPAVFDPVHLARQGEETLRAELAHLNLEQLRDIVADFGMDTGKLVVKWRTPERIIDRIVEVSLGRAQKGDAFREKKDDEGGEETSG
jgi:hypothetical protein